MADPKKFEHPQEAPSLLTEAEAKILTAIFELTAELGYAPSHTQLLARVGWRSRGSLNAYLKRLRAAGAIEGTGRAMRVTEPWLTQKELSKIELTLLGGIVSLTAVGSDAPTRAELGAHLQWSSRSIDAYLPRLRALTVTESEGRVRITHVQQLQYRVVPAGE